jgi:hypothetical protein
MARRPQRRRNHVTDAPTAETSTFPVTAQALYEDALAAQLMGDNAASPASLGNIASPAVAPGLAKASALESTLRERHDENRYDRLGRVDPRGRFDRRGNLL